MQEKHLRLLEELDLFFKDMGNDDEDWNKLVKIVDSLVKSVNKSLASVEELEKDIAILKSNSHPPAFTEKHYKDILKRIKKVENG